MTAAAMVLALILEAAFGWPDALYRRIGHPVTWMGALISWLDRSLNHGSAGARRQRGTLAAAGVILVSAGLAVGVQALVPDGAFGLVLTACLAAPFLASRSLHQHVAAVARPLIDGEIDLARQEVSKIVGRDPQMLDAAGIARASLESLGENSSDGVVAPLFWGVLLGLPGLVAYKAINTLDSMIGYKTPQHTDFGCFAAKLDDLVNWLPARLTALAFALVSGRPQAVLRQCMQDAPRHRSPNGGWPETALASALGCRLSGPRAYENGVEHQPWINEGAPDPAPQDIVRGLSAFWRMLMLVGTLALGLALGALM